MLRRNSSHAAAVGGGRRLISGSPGAASAAEMRRCLLKPFKERSCCTIRLLCQPDQDTAKTALRAPEFSVGSYVGILSVVGTESVELP